MFYEQSKADFKNLTISIKEPLKLRVTTNHLLIILQRLEKILQLKIIIITSKYKMLFLRCLELNALLKETEFQFSHVPKHSALTAELDF